MVLRLLIYPAQSHGLRALALNQDATCYAIRLLEIGLKIDLLLQS